MTIDSRGRSFGDTTVFNTAAAVRIKQLSFIRLQPRFPALICSTADFFFLLFFSSFFSFFFSSFSSSSFFGAAIPPAPLLFPAPVVAQQRYDAHGPIDTFSPALAFTHRFAAHSFSFMHVVCVCGNSSTPKE